MNPKAFILTLIASCLLTVAKSCSDSSVPLNFAIEENGEPGSVVANLKEALNSTLQPPYTESFFMEAWLKKIFEIDYETTGIIRTLVKLDREVNDTYSFYVMKGAVPLCINITVIDINDNAPVFQQKHQVLSISERAPPHKLSLKSVVDKDIGLNTIAGFRLASGNTDYAFNVTGRYSGPQKLLLDLGINGSLDYETTTSYTLIIQVYDGGNPPRTSEMTVDITIEDYNDNQPIFNQSRYSSQLPENATVGTTVVHVFATDLDSGDNGKVHYYIDRNTDPDEYFVIDRWTGVIKLNKKLDYETTKMYVIFAVAIDSGNQSVETKAAVDITVTNINEQPADIYITYLTADSSPRIQENAPFGQTVARVSVSDPEAPDSENANIDVILEGANGYFHLKATGPGTFQLEVAGVLDRERQASYNLTLIAEDNGSPPLSASQSLTLYIDDVNDNSPTFEKVKYEAEVSEMSEEGSSVLLITATDLDIGENAQISYHIQDSGASNAEWFQVDSRSGLITTRGQVDCEVDSQPSFMLVATDHGEPALSTSVLVVVYVKDINDKEPTFDQSIYYASVQEDQTIQSCIIQVNATDPDCGVNGQIRYFISNDSALSNTDWFYIEEKQGRICIKRELDHELHSVYKFSIVAKDTGDFSSTANIQINVLDVNDNYPIFYPVEYLGNIQDNAQPGTEIVTVQATDQDSKNFGDVTYSIVADNSAGLFRIDANTGTVYLQQSLPSGERRYTLTIDATDGGNLSALRRAEVQISVTGPGYSPPDFERSMYRFKVLEDVATNSPIGIVKATYAESSADIKYSITSGDRNSFFTIDENLGIIKSAKPLDHDEYPSLLLSIMAKIGNTLVFGNAQVNITIEDVNDNAPEFSNPVVTTSISEAISSMTAIYSVYATDKDSRANGEVRYSLISNPGNLFTIDATSGEITLGVGQRLDFEVSRQHTLVIMAQDQGQNRLSSSLTLIVNVQDANDNAPMFTTKVYLASVTESRDVNFRFLQIEAVDLDDGDNGRVTYHLEGDNDGDKFGIFPLDGFLYLRDRLDREQRSQYVLTVIAKDHGQPSKTATATVSINVMDANDNKPQFSQSEYHFYVEEELPLGRQVGKILASDRDIGNNAVLQFSFAVEQDDFSIDNTGLIVTTRKLDRELKPGYDFMVRVQDMGTPTQESTCQVYITVTDVNDHPPAIQNSQFVEHVDENKPKGVRVAQIVAHDPDAGENSTITFTLETNDNADDLKYFAIHPKDGWITTKEVLDYEVKNNYSVMVVATDGGTPSLTTRRAFIIKVNDDNDEAPIFLQNATETFYVVENTPINTFVGQVQAHDRDGGENGRVSYYIIGGNHFGLFDVSKETGTIFTIRDIDFEESSSHTVGIKAIDNSVFNPKSSIITIKIQVLDVNDNAPVFEVDPVILAKPENLPISTAIHTFTAVDADSGVNGTVRYEIVSSSEESKLHIDSVTGRLMISDIIDYEQVKFINMMIRAYDQAPTSDSQLFSYLTVMILIKDINDNPPVFQPYQTLTVLEDEPIGYKVATIIATDADGNVNKSGNNNVSYSIRTGNTAGAFSIHENTGALMIASELDREMVNMYSLRIVARDHGSPVLEAETTISVKVMDVNDNSPHFVQSTYQANVTENSVEGTLIIQLSASDDDEGQNQQLTYKIPNGIADEFSIDPVTGLVTLATNDLDREKKSSYIITAHVEDAGTPRLYDTATIIINVTDVNDSPPIFMESRVSVKVPENLVQDMLHTFIAHDADEGDNAHIRYSILGGNEEGKFHIDEETGVFSCQDPLDRETRTMYTLRIQATDGKYTAESTLYVVVKDQNDNNPEFTKEKYSKVLFEDVRAGTTVVHVTATDADEDESGEVTYSLHNDSDTSLFEIDSETGVIITKGTFDREKKSYYSFDVVASDGGKYDRRSEKVRVEVTIGDINDNPPVFQEVPYRKNVSQGQAPGSLILQVIADDKDAGRNKEVSYSFSTESSPTALDLFSISTTSGEIRTKKVLESDALGYHNLKVVATDNGETPLSSTGVIEIIVGSSGGQSFQFRSQNYTSSLFEHASVGTQLITVELENVPSIVTYSFPSGNQDNAFTITSSGTIMVRTPSAIDYEANEHMRLIVAAVSQGVYAYTTVWVNLKDINDNAPQFSQDKYVTKVYENYDKFTYVTQVIATDADSAGRNSDIIYNIIQGNIDEAFTIDPPHSGLITTNLRLDYEVKKTYKLIIEAKDNGENGTMSSTCTVRISVIDVNDNDPQFPKTKPINASEATEVGSVLTMITANDVDISPPLMYNFSSGGNPDGTFSIDRYSGILRLAKSLDRERRKHYLLGLEVSDGRSKAYTTCDVYVEDENDNSPVFSQQSYEVSVEELTAANQTVIQVNASDADAGVNAEITYSLAWAPSQQFYINAQTGVIFTNETVQYRPNQEIIQLVVTATDGGPSRPLSAVVAVYIQVTSVNKFAPVFMDKEYMMTVSEDKEPGFVVLHVQAQDKDTWGHNKEVDYSITAGNLHTMFGIDQKLGRIMLNGELDRENTSEYNLTVMAKDRGIPPKQSTTAVHIVVQDVNDQIPFFSQPDYHVTLAESYPSDTSFLKIHAEDKDEGANAKLYFAITSGNEEGLFIMNPGTGEMFIMSNKSLDYEQSAYHKLVVRATDCTGCESSSPQFANITTVYVNVTDINEYPPVFPTRYYEGVDEEMDKGSYVFTAHANDKDGGPYGVVTYNMTGSDLFSIHYRSGIVTTNTRFDYEATRSEAERTFKFDIHAVDAGGRRASVQVILSLMDKDDYKPEFVQEGYSFDVPGDAKAGTYIGTVHATDADTGAAGRLVYQFKPPQRYFGINATSGDIRVLHDLNREIAGEVSRRKREVNTFTIEASSGMSDSLAASVIVNIDVDRTCVDCGYQTTRPRTEEAANNSIAIIIGVVCAFIILVVIVIIILIFVRKRFHGKKNHPPSETPMCDSEEFDHVPHTHGPPAYRDVIRFGGNHVANVTASSDMSAHSHQSGSSGRGSAEDDEDEELAMINSTSGSFLNTSNGFRKAMPDSGIQDDDNTSEPSVQNHQDYLARLGIDTAKINSKAKSGLTHSVESMHQFSDSGGGEGDGMEIDVIDYSKPHVAHVDPSVLMDKHNHDINFHEAEPHMAGSLSNVINSEEQFSGSYNWDYLLDWGPQYQPLAHVFAEIARLKDDKIQPKKQAVHIVPQQRQIPNGQHQIRTVPPPMITDAPPKVIAQPAVRSNRSSHSSGGSNLNSARNSTINTSLPSMPRSPISHESSFTSPALTPSFTPSLSPLATRSPSVSPVNSGRGLVSSNHSSGPNTPRGRNNNNNKYVFSSSGSEQELRI